MEVFLGTGEDLTLVCPCKRAQTDGQGVFSIAVAGSCNSSRARKRVYSKMTTAQRAPSPPLWAFGGNLQPLFYQWHGLLFAGE